MKLPRPVVYRLRDLRVEELQATNKQQEQYQKKLMNNMNNGGPSQNNQNVPSFLPSLGAEELEEELGLE
jgi:hypothetical protein